MRRGPLVTATALAAAVLATSCDAGPPPEPAAEAPMQQPVSVPAADGPVTTGTPVTVIQKPAGRVEMCLGATTMVFPPDCGGPAVAGWSWRTHREGVQAQAGTRFGRFVLVGAWDGEELAVADAVPASRAEPPAEPPQQPGAGTTVPPLTGPQLRTVAEQVGALPGASGAAVVHGRVRVDVVYDDGSIQAWCDRAYGEGAVLVLPQLRDV